MKNYFIVFFIVLLVLKDYSAVSQGLCNNSNYEKGEFEINDVNVCGPNLIRLKTGSGVTNAKYIFDYQAENIEEVRSLANIQDAYAYSDIGKPKTYTILQLAEKKGKISIACKNVNVRTNNEPVYSYTVCGSMVEFDLPIHPLNDFDYYYLEIGSKAPIAIQKSELPFRVRNTLSLPQRFKISGLYLDAAKNCPNIPSSKTIPAPSIIRYLPFYPNIDKIELLSLSNVKLDYSGPFTTDASLFRFEKNASPTSAIEVKKNLVPGQYEFSIPDSNKSYCFFVKKNNICDNLTEESAEICTKPLTNVDFNPNSMRYELKWDQYPSTFKGLNLIGNPMSIFTGMLYIPTQKINIKLANLNPVSISWPSFASSYLHNGLDCKKEYCYQVEQVISGTIGFAQYYGISKSNKVCKDQSKVTIPAVSKIYTTTQNSKNAVFIEDDKAWPLKKEKWFFYKKSQKGYDKIDSTLNINQGFQDDNLVSKLESYKVSYIDECDSKSFLSDSVSSVFLDFKSSNTLNWTNQSPFSNISLDKYEIFYLKEDDGQLVKIKDTNLNQTIVDLDPFRNVARFLVKTISSELNPKVSLSNIVIYNIPPQIFFPDAFTPNGDGENDILEIKGKLSRIKSLEMQVFNRFGHQVASINDITDSWDGTFKGKVVDPGIYSYKVKANLDTGEKYSKSGVIQVLR